MSDIMRPIPFSQLMDWALSEYHTSVSYTHLTLPTKA